MSKQANEIRKQIEELQAQLNKLEKPSRDLKSWKSDLRDLKSWKSDLRDLQEAIKTYQGNVKYFHEQIAAEEREIAFCEKECAKLKALIENAKKPKARK